MGLVGVDEVGRGSAVGLVIGDALDEVVGVEAGAVGLREEGSAEVGLIDGDDDAAKTWGTRENSSTMARGQDALSSKLT